MTAKLIASHAEAVKDRAYDTTGEIKPFKIDLLSFIDAEQTFESMRAD
ncbi:MAG: hypothetical protein ABSH48_12845 [Verrucomicrobiota bacterium]|jgi:hypothetical protein